MRTWIMPSRWPAALVVVTLAGLLPLAASVARALRRREPGVEWCRSTGSSGAEDTLLYPLVAELLDDDPTAPMHRAHAEIATG